MQLTYPGDTRRKITSLLRQNDVATSFWRNNDAIIASCVRWVDTDYRVPEVGKSVELM